MRNRRWISAIIILLSILVIYAIGVPYYKAPDLMESCGLCIQALHLESVDGVVGYSVDTGVIRTINHEALSTQVIYTTNDYSELINLDLVTGAFVLTNHTAVISEELAVSLFHTAEVVGQHLLVNDEDRIISGVVSRPITFLETICSRADVVYIEAENGTYTNVIAEANATMSGHFERQGLVNAETAVIFSTESVLFRLPRSLLGLLIKMAAIMFCGTSFAMFIKNTRSYIQCPTPDLRQKKQLLTSGMILLLSLLCVIASLLFVENLSIPRVFLPEDGVFRWDFFFVHLTNYMQSHINCEYSSIVRMIRVSGILGSVLYIGFFPVFLHEILVLERTILRHNGSETEYY